MPRRRPPFDAVADLYDRVRPGYPDESVDDLVELARLPRRGRVLEIGPATGQLSVSIAERGYSLTAVEVGPALAERARRNLSAYSDAKVVCARFEDVELPPRSFDVVVAATSFHWLDPATAYPKAATLLRPTGALGLLWNVHLNTDEGFFAESEEVYARVAPHLLGPGTSARAKDRHARAAEIDASECFGDVQVRSSAWSAEYSASRYLELLSTYSDHIELDPDVRQRLFDGLSELIRTRYRGRVKKHYETVLYVAPVRPEGSRGHGPEAGA